MRRRTLIEHPRRLAELGGVGDLAGSGLGGVFDAEARRVGGAAGFEGAGGDTLGALASSKDHRPDLEHVVSRILPDSAGLSIAWEMWPDHTNDDRDVPQARRQPRPRPETRSRPTTLRPMCLCAFA